MAVVQSLRPALVLGRSVAWQRAPDNPAGLVILGIDNDWEPSEPMVHSDRPLNTEPDAAQSRSTKMVVIVYEDLLGDGGIPYETRALMGSLLKKGITSIPLCRRRYATTE